MIELALDARVEPEPGGADTPARGGLWPERPAVARWTWPVRLAIALVAGVLYTVDLSINEVGNTYYAAAVYSGTQSWKAFLFGSLDPTNSITVDKPPAALWVQELSARLFGFSSWSLLVPEALAGVATVLIVYHLVQRWLGDVAAVMASLALAVTPVVVLMFRLNDPDALLTFFVVAAAWALWWALESGAWVAMVASGALVGLAFITKDLQALVVLPAFAGAYLWCGPFDLRRRVLQCLAGALALIVTGGWWVTVVSVWPEASRPFIGGSTDNSEANLILSYNGVGRLVGGQAGESFGGPASPWRMFDPQVGGQVAWLLPLALVGLVAGLWWTRRAPRTDRRRAGFVLWGGWTLGTVAVFSLSRGTFHPYYTVALAPGVAGLAAGGAVALWQLGQASLRWACALTAAVLGSAAWATALLQRSHNTGLARLVLVGGLVAAGLVLVQLTGRARITPWAAVAATVVLLIGPAAYSLATVRESAAPLTPTAGPLGGGGSGGLALAGPAGSARGVVVSRLDVYLEDHAGTARFLAAVTSAQQADVMILATGRPVMAMGGFLGTDPWPSVPVFERAVASGQVRFVLLGGGGFPEGGAPGSAVAAVDRWVRDHGSAVPSSAIGGWRGGILYDVAPDNGG